VQVLKQARRFGSEEVVLQVTETAVYASRQRTEPQIACCAGIPHRDKKPFSSSSNHRIIRILLRGIFGCSFLKMGFKGTLFANMEDIKLKVIDELQAVPTDDFFRCF
jgi:hypothetical protein